MWVRLPPRAPFFLIENESVNAARFAVYLTCTLHLGNEEGIAAAHWIPAARASCAVIAANCSTSFASPTAPKAIGQGKEGTSLSLVATPRSKSAATSKGSIESRWN